MVERTPFTTPYPTQPYATMQNQFQPRPRKGSPPIPVFPNKCLDIFVNRSKPVAERKNVEVFCVLIDVMGKAQLDKDKVFMYFLLAGSSVQQFEGYMSELEFSLNIFNEPRSRFNFFKEGFGCSVSSFEGPSEPFVCGPVGLSGKLRKSSQATGSKSYGEFFG